MRITIDTKEDSREELKRVICFLSALVGEPVLSNAASEKDIFANKDAFENNNAFASLFGDAPTSNPGSSTPAKDEKSDEEPQVEFIY